MSEYRPQAQIPRRGQPAAPHDSVRWNVFARDGAWIGAVALPARFWPHDLGRDYVLGTNRDDDDVQRITMYRLTRQ